MQVGEVGVSKWFRGGSLPLFFRDKIGSSLFLPVLDGKEQSECLKLRSWRLP